MKKDEWGNIPDGKVRVFHYDLYIDKYVAKLMGGTRAQRREIQKKHPYVAHVMTSVPPPENHLYVYTHSQKLQKISSILVNTVDEDVKAAFNTLFVFNPSSELEQRTTLADHSKTLGLLPNEFAVFSKALLTREKRETPEEELLTKNDKI